MSDKTRYEKDLAQALKKLPLPSEDAAWDDMSKLLDEDDKMPPPPFYRNNIVMGSIIGALVIGALLLFLCTRKTTDNKQVNDQTNKSTQLNTNNKSDNKELSNTKNAQKDLNSTNNNTNTAINNPTVNNSKPDNKKLSAAKNDHKNLKSTDNNTNARNNNSAKVTNGNNSSKNTNANQPVAIGNNTNIAEQTSGNTHTNNLKNNTAVLSVVKVNSNNTSPSNNKNSSKNDQVNHKKIIATNKAVNNSTTPNDVSTGTDKIEAGNNQLSNKTIKNSPDNTIGASGAGTTAVSLSAKHKTNHITAVKLSGKTTANIKSATQDNDAIITTNNTTSAVTPKNTPVLKSNSIDRHEPVKHSTTLPYYDESTANVVSLTKSSKHGYHKKGNTSASTKANTKVKIVSSTGEENDNIIIDTTQLIKIGQSVIANKKAKHPPVIKKDTSTIKPLVAAIKDSTNKKKEKQLRITVGIAEQQAIRLTCDCIYPNDAYKKASLATDYIPSVYVHIQPAKKWFIEAELKYKAPQYIQEQLYKTSVSDQPLNYTTSYSILKKVYYNQIPISFNYYIIPHLSIGAGVIYNNFAGQTTQQNVAKKLYGGGDSIISSSITTSKHSDSSISFTENSFQGLVQSQYDWRRWSVGVRYAIGLQPYVKYKDPISGNLIEKKNDALTVFIRFELWDSKKKKKK